MKTVFVGASADPAACWHVLTLPREPDRGASHDYGRSGQHRSSDLASIVATLVTFD